MEQFIMLMLTCASPEEAEKISCRLLEMKLIACAKQLPVKALFQWQGAIDHAQEIMLCMETVQKHCAVIDAEVRILHSYTTYVLVGMPLVYVSEKAAQWLRESVQ
jgi:periplasmic divalent cation tolerance protein